ncbi:MAG TPA: hypothetical protein VFO34_05335 [Candidatus Acidoferrales bacterium]|nr:hypothetical protein [Candidatus Acidoferrales bacterium]
MKKRVVVSLCLFTLMFGIAATALLAAENPAMGTWKLNEAKSKFDAGATKNQTVTYTADGDNIKCTIDGTDGSGKAVHSEWTGKFDGKEYAIKGDSTADMRSYKNVDAHTVSIVTKKDGKVTLTAKIVYSADWKTRTVTVSATGADGKKSTSTAVYDKQ